MMTTNLNIKNDLQQQEEQGANVLALTESGSLRHGVSLESHEETSTLKSCAGVLGRTAAALKSKCVHTKHA